MTCRPTQIEALSPFTSLCCEEYEETDDGSLIEHQADVIVHEPHGKPGMTTARQWCQRHVPRRYVLQATIAMVDADIAKGRTRASVARGSGERVQR